MDTDRLLSSHNVAFLEALYEAFERDPSSIAPEWRALIEHERARTSDGARRPTNGNGRSASGAIDAAALGEAARSLADRAEQIALQARVDRLIEHYRLIGHLRAQIDPLGRPRTVHTDALDLGHFELAERHLDRSFDPGELFPGRSAVPLRDILGRLQRTYTGGIGVEYWQIFDVEQRDWLREQMESTENRVVPTPEDQIRLLRSLTRADAVDKFLHAKFIGAKRFSIAGAESIIALLETVVEESGDLGVDEIIFGMAHRGRLSVLLTLLGATPAQVFSRFAGNDPHDAMGSGDVKYHLGSWRSYVSRSGRPMYLALAFNPSHLEAITPVINGRVRASQDRRPPDQRDRALAVTLHGDAAFMGQGVVAETLNLSLLPGYGNDGSIRVVINNQLGFTTEPKDGRSTIYPTAVADMLNVPIFHVNGDDPEAAYFVGKLAAAFRKKFHRDVIIDLVCYRKYGHNEGDEPTFTQPRMYELIAKRKPVREHYEDTLIERGTVTREDCDKLQAEFRDEFERALSDIKTKGPKSLRSPMHGIWENYVGGPESPAHEVPTGIDHGMIDTIGRAVTTLPPGFNLHPKLHKFIAELGEMAAGHQPVSWAMAEHLAYGSLLLQGHHVRLSGQDSIRGTFTHRHSAYFDTETGERYVPLSNLGGGQGRFNACNSPLSEFAVMGFEFGYSLAAPDTLVIWEAQFGDFNNGAQIVVDQFLSSSEDKWNRISGLVLMLPHGFEGQGPEHSSARLERFLQLAAEDNIQVCNFSTPAQLFHAFRRQELRKWRKPLIVMAPKSLLRTRASYSPLDEFVSGQFHRIIDDTSADKAKVKRIMLCSGKVYYDLVRGREERKRNDVAIVRIEQLYPFQREALDAVLAGYPAATELMWVQEEPFNMGAWPYMRPILRAAQGARFTPAYAGRPERASPATGSPDSHELEQRMILDDAFVEQVTNR
ncbi:MAG TPA: 2-oxoglutarate dehydrogenase E1 component [Nannocystaceae bacterium]|nr:2-oxoglutarate dehydrogenase E1 component [Nannocystaceae bacterium]